MDVGAKLQIRSGTTVAVLDMPDGVQLTLPEGVAFGGIPAAADAVIAFLLDSSAIDAVAGPALQAAREDRLAWLAYPKAGKLNTDLNRDSLAELAAARGVRPVRQIAIDATWSALRFRPA